MIPTDREYTPLNSLMNRRIKLNWEVVAFIVILLVAIFTRFYVLGDRVMSHDESLHTRFSYNLYNEGNFQHTPLMHGPILFHATAMSYYLFGDNDFSSRIYTSVLGVLVVMSPWLFRRWLGPWGAVLASLMLLISPLMLYYNRYIRHDTPSILYAILMLWGILMYLSGPANQRRRAHWLYVIAAAMILNLGSKETAFIYIAIFGVLLAIYWFIRLAQHFWNIPGRTVFNYLMMGTLLGGVMTLGFYIIIDIIPAMILPGRGTPFDQLSAIQQQSFITWTLLTIGSIVAVIVGTALWTHRDAPRKIRWGQIALLVGLALVVGIGLLIFEEFTHTQPTSLDPVAPVVPGDEASTTGFESLRWWPMILTWIGSIAAIVLVIVTRIRDRRHADSDGDKRGRGFWGTLDLFPEFDLIVVIGTLILPWATALIPYLMRGSAADFTAIANSLPPFLNNALLSIPQISTPVQVGQVVLNLLAWIPLIAVSTIVGLAWDWRRWLVAAAIFYAIFAFFFTTVFTNIAGLATGMVYSLGYWLEQQGVRRGSQPQYYYLLIIMPFYEFLPILGSVLAMLAGTVMFWRRRRRQVEAAEALKLAALTDEQTVDDIMTVEGEDPVAVTDPNPKRKLTAEEAEAIRAETRLTELSFLLTFSWLAVLNLVGYSLAGEKMPWLGTHLTMPMIFLSAWYFGGIIERVNFKLFVRRGWILLAMVTLLLVTVIQALRPLLLGEGPFGGLRQDQLMQTYGWLAAVGISGGVAYVVMRLSETTGARHLRQMLAIGIFAIMSVLTFRSAWIASFINYDYPNEFLVYAHAAPAIKWVLDDIEELSLRTTDGYELRFAYDNSVSWPYSWYFRNYPNAVFVGENPTVQNLEDAIVVVVGDDKRGVVEPILEDRYQRFDHMRLWWPMQDYFNLTAERVQNALDFSPENANAAQIRRGMFDIWWSRDYTTYGQATEKTFNLTRWPVSDTMHVYIRRDVAAQVWEYGTGDGTVLNPLENVEENLCNVNWVEQPAMQIIQSPDNPMLRPIGIAIADDGSIYVSEEYGHRITQFDSDGNFVRSIGRAGTMPSDGSLTFNRPNSLSIGPDGNFYVADTWNYRVAQINEDGEVLASWGQPGEFGFDAPVIPNDAFWGPRDVKVDNEGRIYVADTGNKRIRVYRVTDGEAAHLYDLGSGGSAAGELDEPSGIAIHPDDGRIFIADTWNRRISVFASDGQFLTNFRVRGWYEEQGNRPYLAIDAERELLYVTDPDAGRVLVYNTAGDCVGSFGQLAGTSPGDSQFSTVGGVAVGPDGNVYVVDSGLNRIMVMPPFMALVSPDAAAPLEFTEEVQPETDESLPLETTEETAPETAEELPLETTEEIQPDMTEELDSDTAE